MSMHNSACSGYVVPVRQLVPLIASKAGAKLQRHIESQDWEAAYELLKEALPVSYPTPESCFVLNPESCFVLNDECESQDLTVGEMYAYFAESDLYVKCEKVELQALKAAGATPTFAQWVIWG